MYGRITDIKTKLGKKFKEIIEPGAFSDTDFSDVALFINHDKSKIPLARTRRNNGNNTMQLSVDEKGLFMRAFLDVENNEKAKTLYHSIKRGDMDRMSFAFKVAENVENWENIPLDYPYSKVCDMNTIDKTIIPVRHITKIEKIVEVSVVNYPVSMAVKKCKKMAIKFCR